MANFTPSWQAHVGINHVGAYQVSGEPYATAAVDCTDAASVKFPYVTRWIQVLNKDSSALRVGFSENGVSGSNYFTVDGNEGSAVLELKVSEVWLYSPGNANAEADIVAGLTSIPTVRCTTDDGPSWSGSAGVG